MQGNCRDRSFCCGGGGLMLFYEPEEEQRMGVVRVQQAKAAGADLAVNKNPKAPIFQAATAGVVADLMELVPVLTEKIQKSR